MGDDIGARVRSVDGLPDVLADLIGAGFTFSTVEDYDKAMEWALRAYRAGQAATPDDEDVVTFGPGDYGTVSADDMAMVARATGGGIRSLELIPQFEDDEAATPDGPRRWALPDEPGSEVTALQDRLGRTWSRMRGLPLWGGHGTGSVLPFIDLLDQYGPLTDATPAADGQDGDGRG